MSVSQEAIFQDGGPTHSEEPPVFDSKRVRNYALVDGVLTLQKYEFMALPINSLLFERRFDCYKWDPNTQRQRRKTLEWMSPEEGKGWTIPLKRVSINEVETDDWQTPTYLLPLKPSYGHHGCPGRL